MTPFEAAFYQRFLIGLGKQYQETLEAIGGGVDPNKYQRLVGQLDGLREAKAIADNLQSEMAKE